MCSYQTQMDIGQVRTFCTQSEAPAAAACLMVHLTTSTPVTRITHRPLHLLVQFLKLHSCAEQKPHDIYYCI